MSTQKVKSHTVYKDTNNNRLPGATTITGILAKPALVDWAWRLGSQGIDYKKFVDDLATVGTLAHQMVQDYFSKTTTNFDDYSKNDKDRAENCLVSFFEWEKGHKIKPILNEEQLVSERFKFGGTLDMYCEMDKVLTLVDFKTSSATYDEQLIQLAGYKILLEEHNCLVERAMIVRIGRDNTEGFEVKELTNFKKYEEIFKNLLKVYYLLKQK